MDGRMFTVLVFLVAPAALIGVTVALFASNPISILVLISVMLIGAFYLMTYQESLS